MNLNSAINKARKLVADQAKMSNSNANKIIVTKEWNKELSGELVVILYSGEEDKVS